MATNNNSSIDDPTSIICPLCEKTYDYKDGPLVLPCLHSYCKSCLVSYLKKEDHVDNKISCPTCSDTSPFPKDVTDYPINLRLAHLARSSVYEKQASSGNVKCEICNEETKTATEFCCNCCKFLCTKCKNYHVRLLSDNDHEFIELASFEKGEFKIHPPPPKCSKHRRQELAFFCDDCKTLICLYCAQTNHQNHNKSSIDDTAENGRAELKEMAKDIDAAVNTMDASVQQVQEMREKVKASKKKAIELIDKECDELIQAVEKRRETMKKKCEEVAVGKDDVLSNQIVQTQRLLKDVSFTKSQAKDAIENHKAEEILNVMKSFEYRLKQVMERYRRESMELRENDSIDVLFEVKPLIQQIDKVGLFSGVPDSTKCDVKLCDGLGKGERGVTVSLRDEMGNPVKGNAHFQYQLNKIGNNSNDDCSLPIITVTQSGNNDGTATLKFTTEHDEEDCYELTIMIRNKPVADPIKIIAIPRDYRTFANLQPSYKQQTMAIQ